MAFNLFICFLLVHVHKLLEYTFSTITVARPHLMKQANRVQTASPCAHVFSFELTLMQGASVHPSVMDLFFAGLFGHCNQRLFWPKSTWHKKAAAFLMSVANLWCQLVLTPHRQIWEHRGPGNIKNSHQQHSSSGGWVWCELGSRKVEQWLCVRAARTVTVWSTGQEVGPEQDGANTLQRESAFPCLSSLKLG